MSHLERLESEAIHIVREAVAEARNPVMLFSAGKDSTVMAHIALRAFHPGKPPFPLLHIDSTWEFGSLLAESWKLVPEVVEMLHVTLAGSRNVEIRLS